MRILNKEIALVCCYFNPCNYYSRFLNFILFLESVKKYKVNLVVVEAHSINSKYRVDKLHENVISVRTDEVYWMKENLLNIGIKFLLEYDIKNIGWIDCDVLVNDPIFLEKVTTSLEKNKVVHLFSECKQWISDTEYKNKTSVCKLSQQHTNLLTLMMCRLGDVGYGYAYNSDILRKVLLYDKAIVGTGDWLNLLGCIKIKNHEELMNDRFFIGASRGFFNSYVSWQKHMSKQVNSSIGFVDTSFEILNHGNEVNRNYVNRETILKKFGYEPVQHLIESGSTYKLQNQKLATAISEYFVSRNEDCNISQHRCKNVDAKLQNFNFRDIGDNSVDIKSTSDYLRLRRTVDRVDINYNTTDSVALNDKPPPTNIKYTIIVSCHTDIDLSVINSHDTQVLMFRKSGKLRKNNILVLSHKFSVSHTYLDYIIKNYYNLSEFMLFCNDVAIGEPKLIGDVFNDPVDFKYINTSTTLTVTYPIQMETTYGRWQNEILNSRKRPIKTHCSSFLVSSEMIRKNPLNFYKNLIPKCNKYENSQIEEYFEKLWGCLFS
jgi:hypothetical protein